MILTTPPSRTLVSITSHMRHLINALVVGLPLALTPVLGVGLSAGTLLRAADAPPSQATPQAKGANEVQGLRLPPDQVVKPDEGFVSVQAEFDKGKEGVVKFLVVANPPGAKVKAVPLPPAGLVIAIPPTPGAVISVFAVAGVDDPKGNGTLTDFARTSITVEGDPQGPVAAAPSLPKVSGRLWVTLVGDTPLSGSPTLRSELEGLGCRFLALPADSPELDSRRLRKAAEGVRGPALLLQADDGRFPLGKGVPCPEKEEGVLSLVRRLLGK